MSDIKRARERLRELARELRDMGQPWARKRILAIVNEDMYRTYTKPMKAKPTARRMNPMLAISVRAYAKKHPRMSNRAIGRHFNVDSGRVSEAIARKW